MRKFAAISLAGIMAFGALPVITYPATTNTDIDSITDGC